MISCNVIQDLLILYASDECSDDSRDIIENHLETCKECQNALITFKEPVLPVKEMNLDGLTRDFKFQKGFKKIRKRWLLSIVSVLLIFPLLGAGFMVRNQVKGQGIAFTNLRELYTTRLYLKAVQEGDYEEAFSYLDVNGMYESVTQIEPESFYDWKKDYSKVQIGDEHWYVNKEVYQSDYQSYLNTGDENAFWSAMMIHNSENRSITSIPETHFDASSRLFAASTDSSADVVDADIKTPNYGYDYAKIKTADGSIFFYPVTGGSFTEDDPMILISDSFVIPARAYEEFMIINEKDIEEIRETSERYKKMKLSSYTDILKKKFMTNMKKLEDQDIRIKSFSHSNIYRHSDTGEWQLDVNLVCEQGSSRSTSGGIIFIAKDNSLKVSGGFYKTDSDDLLMKVIELLSLNEYPE